MSQKPALKMEGVFKRYGRIPAVDGVTFEVREGEIFALLGPNGAGKTTLVRMLTGITKPDEGSIQFSIGGGAAGDQPAPGDFGYLPEERGVFTDIPVIRTLEFFGGLRGMKRADARKEGEHWLKRFELHDRMGDKIQTLSKGNQQKVQFIGAIIHKPTFAILDEPFSGLDPVNQDMFLDVLRELRANGMTILLSAHQMQLVERLADRILLLARGREVLSGTLDEIQTRSHAGSTVHLRLGAADDEKRLADLAYVQDATRRDDGSVRVILEPGATLAELLRFAANNFEILDVQTGRMSLHDIYVRAVGEDRAAQPTPEAVS